MNIKVNWLLAALLIIATIAAVYFYKKSLTVQNYAAAVKILADPNAPVIDTFRDKQGRQHVEISATANTVPQAALKDSSVKRDSVIGVIDAALNLTDATHLLEVTQENLQLKAVVLRLKKDSANKSHLTYADNWLKFYYDTRDSSLHNFSYNVGLNAVRYNKQKLFGSSQIYDFYADDPRATLSGFNHFVVSIPPPSFGLTVDTKATYGFNSGHITPSVGIDARFGNFHVEGRDYWSVDNRRFQQLLSFGYRQSIF